MAAPKGKVGTPRVAAVTAGAGGTALCRCSIYFLLGTTGHYEGGGSPTGRTEVVAVGKRPITRKCLSRAGLAPSRLLLTGVACGSGVWLLFSAAAIVVDIRQQWVLTGVSLLASLGMMSVARYLLADPIGVFSSLASLAARNVELTRAVDELRFSESRLRDLAEISSEWFWEQNAELRYTWFSHAVW